MFLGEGTLGGSWEVALQLWLEGEVVEGWEEGCAGPPGPGPASEGPYWGNSTSKRLSYQFIVSYSYSPIYLILLVRVPPREGPPFQLEDTWVPWAWLPGLSSPMHGETPETLWEDSWPREEGGSPGWVHRQRRLYHVKGTDRQAGLVTGSLSNLQGCS